MFLHAKFDQKKKKKKKKNYAGTKEISMKNTGGK